MQQKTKDDTSTKHSEMKTEMSGVKTEMSELKVLLKAIIDKKLN